MKLVASILLASQALAQSTTWREAAPLLDRYCNACHRAGQVGPFDFTTYDGASAYAPEIARYLLGNKMPPWRAKPSPLAFSNSKAIPDVAMAQLLRWIQTGAKPGAASGIAKRHPQWNLGAPDLVVSQPREHTVSAEKTVDIVSFDIAPAELGTTDGDRTFNAFELRPSNRNLLHHALLKVAGQPIAAAAMCDTGFRLPAGVGWRLPKATPLTVELHYFKRNLRSERDQTRLALYFTKQPPRRLASLLEISKADIRIPAGANLHAEKTTFSIAVGLHLHALLPVFQLLAEQVRIRKRGQSDYFLWVEPFEHHLMSSYQLARALPLEKGAVLEAEAIYDNSTQNPYNPHRKLREVRFAENGLDETFQIWLTISR